MARFLALLIALSSLGVSALLAGGQGSASQRGDFRHARHVSLLWPGSLNNPVEAPRDCRGCHDYSQPEPAANPRPSEVCARCHTLGSMEFDVSGARVDPTLEATRSFRHFDHRSDRDGEPLACLACHADPEVSAGRRGRAEEPPIVIPAVDAAFCASCHAGDDRDAFDAGLTKAAELRSRLGELQVERPFRHSEHLSPSALAAGDQASCKACHPDLPRADALRLSEHQLHLAGCEQCHTGVSFELETFTKPSATAATFVHAYHLGADRGRPGLEDATERLRREGCAACHEFAPEQDTFVVKDFLAAPGRGQAGCVECHSDWEIPNHGRSDACSHCHSVQEGSLASLAAQAQNRPRNQVLRADPSAFRIEEHSHPLVHGQTGPHEDCARCHVATLERAPSRIGTKPFRHDLHLPADLLGRSPGEVPSSACTGCHTSIAQAISSEGIVGTRHGEVGSGASFNFEQERCGDCHESSALEALVDLPVQPRSALAFDHRAHLAKTHPLEPDRRMTCVDCHALEAAPGDWRIVSAAKVENCTLCHGHDEQRAPITAALDRRALDACTSCHAPGVPRRGQPVEVERARLGAAQGFHVHASQTDCASCHVAGAEGSPRAPRAEVQSRLFATWSGSNSPHLAGRRPDSNRPFFQDESACIDCHWGNMERPKHHINDQFKRQRDSALERVREAADLPQESQFRRRFGAELEGFPGREPR